MASSLAPPGPKPLASPPTGPGGIIGYSSLVEAILTCNMRHVAQGGGAQAIFFLQTPFLREVAKRLLYAHVSPETIALL